MIAIIDYGAGNLHSVKNALDFIGTDSFITDNAEATRSADGVILPGVGAFADAMQAMHNNHLEAVVREAANGDKPFLGICLGLQLLFEGSEESPGCKGLGILKGKITRIPGGEGRKVPHMGWNSIAIQQKQGLLEGIGDNAYMYFVHSYYLQAQDPKEVAATTQYGVQIDAAVQKGNLMATQFHPEKSGDVGIQILRNFTKLCKEG